LPRKKAVVCGTQEGYEKHLQRSERPCASCLVGSVTYTDIEVARQIETFREKRRDQRLWNNCGILRVTFEQIFDEQGRLCGCCKASDPKQGWYIDFDPAGTIRGILCSDCNLGIEKLGDDAAGVQRAVTYLQCHATRGGHPQHEDPVSFAIKPGLSECMETCFKHFDEGLPISKVSILKKLTADTVREIHELWISARAATRSS